MISSWDSSQELEWEGIGKSKLDHFIEICVLYVTVLAKRDQFRKNIIVQ